MKTEKLPRESFTAKSRQLTRYHFYVGLVTKDRDFIFTFAMAKEMVIEVLPFSGATISEGTGVYKGEVEPSMCIEAILTAEEVGHLDHYNKIDLDVVDSFAIRLKDLFKQETIMVTKENIAVKYY